MFEPDLKASHTLGKVKKYSNVSIPRATFLKLTKLVGHEGFRSTAEVVMHCVRRCMNEIDMWLDQIEKEDILHDIKGGT